jgi:hypothetical protein
MFRKPQRPGGEKSLENPRSSRLRLGVRKILVIYWLDAFKSATHQRCLLHFEGSLAQRQLAMRLPDALLGSS